MNSVPEGIAEATDKLFKIKKIRYNTYDVQHSKVRGQLRTITIPNNFLQLPHKFSSSSGLPSVALASQTLVSFTNFGKKQVPTTPNVTPEIMATSNKTDLTRFCENSYEPWCEFVLQGDPPLLVRIKTVLTRVDWLVDHVSYSGDPFLWAYSNTSLEVFQENDTESGLE